MMFKGITLIFFSLPIFIYLYSCYDDGAIRSLGAGASLYFYNESPIRFIFHFSVWLFGGCVCFIYGLKSIVWGLSK